MKKVKEQKEERKDIRIILVKNHEQMEYYFGNMIGRLKAQNREYKIINDGNAIEDETDRYLFITPDDKRKLAGLHIAGFDDMGDVYQHPHYYDMIKELENRII